MDAVRSVQPLQTQRRLAASVREHRLLREGLEGLGGVRGGFVHLPLAAGLGHVGEMAEHAVGLAAQPLCAGRAVDGRVARDGGSGLLRVVGAGDCRGGLGGGGRRGSPGVGWVRKRVGGAGLLAGEGPEMAASICIGWLGPRTAREIWGGVRRGVEEVGEEGTLG